MGTSNADRANVLVQELPKRDQPISEVFRLVAKAWVDADAAARLLEETKGCVFSKLVLDMIEKSKSDEDPGFRQVKGVSNAQAEHMARSSEEYQDHIAHMVTAKSKANKLKVQMEFVRMQFTEWQMGAAAARDERKMSR